MANVFDVALYILQKQGETTAMKLQKLVYYAQAWHLVWEDTTLFEEPIEAWVNGPVVPRLYAKHQGKFKVTAENLVDLGNVSNLSEAEKESIDAVLSFYADKSSQWLSDLTHAETPWKVARKGLLPNERGNHEILLASMAEYYSGLQ